MNYSRCQIIGNIGERWVYDQLKSRGYDVVTVSNYQSPCVDLTIGTLPIEVKYSRISYRRKINKRTGEVKRYQRWQWDVSKVHSNGDLVLFLIAEDEAMVRHPFIMPGSVMAERIKFEIGRHPTQYKGLISGYLNAWETVDFLLEQSYYDDRQMTIYHALTDEGGVYTK